MAKKNLYNLEDYADFSKATAAEQKKTQAESAVQNYGDLQYGRQQDYDAAIDSILNMKPFEYNLNEDALYEQYKNQYQALGKLAMQDTIGQASALTGGYANSYAATAGNQAYQQYLTKLNEVIPSLYQMALDRYSMEQDQANQRYSILNADYNNQYEKWKDGLNRVLDERDYANTDYNNLYSIAVQQARNAIADEQSKEQFEYQKDIDTRNFEYQKDIDTRNFEYQKERDAVADSQAKINDSAPVDDEPKKQTKEDVLGGIMAFRDYDSLQKYLYKKVEDGVISEEDFNEACAEFVKKRGNGVKPSGSTIAKNVAGLYDLLKKVR